jgi:aldehyde dehydrogenase (NAD+)
MVSLLASAPVEEETSRFLGGDLVIRHEPIGVIAGIVPWNYPQTLSSFKYAPALAAGNTIVLKPSPETVLDSYLFAEAVIAAGRPPGVVNIVPGGREIGAYLVQHPDVDKVALTSRRSTRNTGNACWAMITKAFILTKDFNRIGVRILRDHGGGGRAAAYAALTRAR